MGEAARRKGGRRGRGGEQRTGAWGKPRERERGPLSIASARTYVCPVQHAYTAEDEEPGGGKAEGGREVAFFFSSADAFSFSGYELRGEGGEKAAEQRDGEREHRGRGEKAKACSPHALTARRRPNLSLSLSPRTAERRGCLCSERGVLYRSRARCGGGRFPRENPPAEGGSRKSIEKARSEREVNGGGDGAKDGGGEALQKEDSPTTVWRERFERRAGRKPYKTGPRATHVSSIKTYPKVSKQQYKSHIFVFSLA